jgi:hypothetical protein
VFAGFDRRAQVDGPETRRRRQHHHVHAGRNDLLVGVEPEEHVLRFDLHLVGARLGRDRFERSSERFLKSVADGEKLDVRISLEGLGRGAGSATATTDKPNFDGVSRRSGGRFGAEDCG